MTTAGFDRAAKAYVGMPGKTLFARLRDPRIGVYPADHAGEIDPDIVVLPCSKGSKFAPAAIDLPPRAAARLRDGAALLVFDASMEGYLHEAAWTAMLHEIAGRLGVPPMRAVYITQDRGYAADYARYCRDSGDVQRLAVLNYDYCIKLFFSLSREEGERRYAERVAAFRRRSRTRGRRFVSLNWIPRGPKVLFLLRLMQEGLWDRGHISFGGFGEPGEDQGPALAHFAALLRRQAGFEDLVDGLAPELPKLAAKGRIALDAPIGGAPSGQALVGDARLPAYEDSWFSVVTETEMLDRPSRITEKPFKALVNFHPLIMLGNPGSLPLIRELGFRSFPMLFDESYDEEPDPRRRFELVYQQTARLCRMDEAELARLADEAEETLVFNAKWGLTRLPLHYLKTIDAALVQALLDRLAAA